MEKENMAAFFDVTGVFFDLKKGSLAFGEYLYQKGLFNSENAEELRKLVKRFANGEKELLEYIITEGARGLAGQKVLQIEEEANKYFKEQIKPIIYQSAIQEVKKLQNEGFQIILITREYEQIVKPLAVYLQADDYYAIRLEKEEKLMRVYTGKTTLIPYFDVKVDLIIKLAKKYSFNLAKCRVYDDEVEIFTILRQKKITVQQFHVRADQNQWITETI
ncbi:MAG: HAD family hydrolase [Candidatus Hermodarchaeota archaeon]